MGKIIGTPKDKKYEYEFMVVLEREYGNYDLYSCHSEAEEAYKTAEEVGGIVAHNLRISHKKLIQ